MSASYQGTDIRSFNGNTWHHIYRINDCKVNYRKHLQFCERTFVTPVLYGYITFEIGVQLIVCFGNFAILAVTDYTDVS